MSRDSGGAGAAVSAAGRPARSGGGANAAVVSARLSPLLCVFHLLRFVYCTCRVPAGYRYRSGTGTGTATGTGAGTGD